MWTMNLGWTIGLAGWLACAACGAGEWTEIPRHATRSGPAGGFDLGQFEVTVAEFVEFLNGVAGTDFPETAQIVRQPAGNYVAKRGVARQAVAEVTPAEAEAYCAWRSLETGRKVHLPTEAEWEVAARGGMDGAPFPWGWGGPPAELAQFDAEGPAPIGGRFVANGFGLFDVAGNLYEWCAPEPDLPEGKRAARGGSWAEHDPALLEVARRQYFPADYRGRDVGFRALREAAKEP
jgi:formylglycine-generating enzyme required for sulfatase activity